MKKKKGTQFSSEQKLLKQITTKIINKKQKIQFAENAQSLQTFMTPREALAVANVKDFMSVKSKTQALNSKYQEKEQEKINSQKDIQNFSDLDRIIEDRERDFNKINKYYAQQIKINRQETLIEDQQENTQSQSNQQEKLAHLIRQQIINNQKKNQKTNQKKFKKIIKNFKFNQIELNNLKSKLATSYQQLINLNSQRISDKQNKNQNKNQSQNQSLSQNQYQNQSQNQLKSRNQSQNLLLNQSNFSLKKQNKEKIKSLYQLEQIFDSAQNLCSDLIEDSKNVLKSQKNHQKTVKNQKHRNWMKSPEFNEEKERVYEQIRKNRIAQNQNIDEIGEECQGYFRFLGYKSSNQIPKNRDQKEILETRFLYSLHKQKLEEQKNEKLSQIIKLKRQVLIYEKIQQLKLQKKQKIQTNFQIYQKQQQQQKQQLQNKKLFNNYKTENSSHSSNSTNSNQADNNSEIQSNKRKSKQFFVFSPTRKTQQNLRQSVFQDSKDNQTDFLDLQQEQSDIEIDLNESQFQFSDSYIEQIILSEMEEQTKIIDDQEKKNKAIYMILKQKKLKKQTRNSMKKIDEKQDYLKKKLISQNKSNENIYYKNNIYNNNNSYNSLNDSLQNQKPLTIWQQDEEKDEQKTQIKQLKKLNQKFLKKKNPENIATNEILKQIKQDYQKKQKINNKVLLYSYFQRNQLLNSNNTSYHTSLQGSPKGYLNYSYAMQNSQNSFISQQSFKSTLKQNISTNNQNSNQNTKQLYFHLQKEQQKQQQQQQFQVNSISPKKNQTPKNINLFYNIQITPQENLQQNNKNQEQIQQSQLQQQQATSESYNLNSTLDFETSKTNINSQSTQRNSTQQKNFEKKLLKLQIQKLNQTETNLTSKTICQNFNLNSSKLNTNKNKTNQIQTNNQTQNFPNQKLYQTQTQSTPYQNIQDKKNLNEIQNEDKDIDNDKDNKNININQNNDKNNNKDNKNDKKLQFQSKNKLKLIINASNTKINSKIPKKSQIQIYSQNSSFESLSNFRKLQKKYKKILNPQLLKQEEYMLSQERSPNNNTNFNYNNNNYNYNNNSSCNSQNLSFFNMGTSQNFISKRKKFQKSRNQLKKPTFFLERDSSKNPTILTRTSFLNSSKSPQKSHNLLQEIQTFSSSNLHQNYEQTQKQPQKNNKRLSTITYPELNLNNNQRKRTTIIILPQENEKNYKNDENNLKNQNLNQNSLLNSFHNKSQSPFKNQKIVPRKKSLEILQETNLLKDQQFQTMYKQIKQLNKSKLQHSNQNLNKNMDIVISEAEQIASLQANIISLHKSLKIEKIDTTLLFYLREIQARYNQLNNKVADEIIQILRYNRKNHQIYLQKLNVEKDLISKQEQYKIFKKQLQEDKQLFQRYNIINRFLDKLYQEKKIFKFEQFFSQEETWQKNVDQSKQNLNELEIQLESFENQLDTLIQPENLQIIDKKEQKWYEKITRKAGINLQILQKKIKNQQNKNPLYKLRNKLISDEYTNENQNQTQNLIQNQEQKENLTQLSLNKSNLNSNSFNDFKSVTKNLKNKKNKKNLSINTQKQQEPYINLDLSSNPNSILNTEN